MSGLLGKFIKVETLVDGWLPDVTPIKLGTVLKVIKTHNRIDYPCEGAMVIEIGGIQYDIKSSKGRYWAFFTKSMVGEKDKQAGVYKDYGLRFTTEEEYVATIPVVEVNKNLRKFEAYNEALGLESKSLQEKYDDWIIENMHVYELFEKFALQAIAAGKKKISHWLIVNRLRWEVEIETKGLTEDERQYKISNDYIAFLARDFIKDHPEHAEIFNLKQMKRV